MKDNFCVISFADKEPYLSEAKQLENLCVESGLKFKLYDLDWLKQTYVYEANKELFDNKKCGYCAWKPYIILDALNSYERVLYLDSSMLFNPESIDKYINENKDEDIVSTITDLKQEFYTKQETFIIMDALDPKYKEDNLYWSGNIFANKKAVDFLYEWLYYCLREECITDECILTLNKNLKYHLYDQSIYSILYSKYNKKHVLNYCFYDTREVSHKEYISEIFGEDYIEKQSELNKLYKDIYNYNSSVCFKN